MEIDAFGIPFAFSDDKDTVNLVYSNEVDFIQVAFLPIVGDDVIESRLAELLPEVAFEDSSRECLIVGHHLLLHVFEIAYFDGTAVFIDEAEPEGKEVVFQFILHVAPPFGLEVRAKPVDEVV